MKKRTKEQMVVTAERHLKNLSKCMSAIHSQEEIGLRSCYLSLAMMNLKHNVKFLWEAYQQKETHG